MPTAGWHGNYHTRVEGRQTVHRVCLKAVSLAESQYEHPSYCTKKHVIDIHGAVLGQLLLGGSMGKMFPVPQAEVSGYGNWLLSSDGIS